MCNQKKLEHFYLVGEKERDVVKEWLLVQKAKNDKEATFVDGISKALVGIDYDYMISGLNLLLKVMEKFTTNRAEKFAIGWQVIGGLTWQRILLRSMILN